MKDKVNLLIIVLIIIACFRYCSHYKIEEDTVQIDTITIIKPQQVIRYVDRIVRDTLYSIDSIPVPVNLPIETKVYQDSNYRAVISGYKASLDSISIFNKNQIQYINKIIYKTKKWNISPSVGFGYGAFNRKFDMYLGFSINYNF